MKNKKIIMISSIIVGVLVVIIGTSYALYNFNRVGKNSSLVVGDIYMHYVDKNAGINLENAMPSETYDATSFFEFTIDGKNTSSKDIYYEILLNKGDVPEGKEEGKRIKDNLLKFTLTETINGTEKTVINGKSYNNLTNKRIWVNTIDKNTTREVSITYRLYMWLSNETRIGNVDQDYTIDEWKDIFASIKVNVAGDFEEKQVAIDLTKQVVSSGDGLVAVNTDGARASEGDTIREYRYSGTSANITNNYVSFNNELWRIVGLFTEITADGKEEQLIKIVRNEELKNLPTSFKASNTYQGTTTETTYTFGSSDGTTAYWNNPNSWTGNENDWTRSGVMHFLNDIYLPVINTKYANMIENVVYHLGNSYNSYTPAKSYTEERGTSICASGVYSNNDDTCQVWYNNQATWTGKIGLLYGSDQAYTRSSGSWTNSLDTSTSYSWLTPTTSNWLLSPHTGHSSFAMYANLWASVNYNAVSNTQFAIRPCLYLKSETVISSGNGTSNNPYQLEI